jgi:hypothetical protein
VLDIGFNKIEFLPNYAFKTMPDLTLLAVDGNPLRTISESTFSHLNSTLRGLSVGGSSLSCDCRLRWIPEWIKRYDLQVTSRERNPKFCSSPPELRTKTFQQIKIEGRQYGNIFSNISVNNF